MPPPPASLPAAPPEWATNTGARDPDPLPAGLQATGWLPGMVLPARALNSLDGALCDWAGYIASLFPATGQMGLTRLDLYDAPLPGGQLAGTFTVRTYAGLGGIDILALRHEDTPASVGILVGSADGDQTSVLIQGSTNRLTVMDVGTVAEHWYSESGIGINATVGIQAQGDADGGRYRYPAADPCAVVHNLGPAYGGWTVLQKVAPVTGPMTGFTNATGFWGFLNLDAVGGQVGSCRYQLPRRTGGGDAVYGDVLTGISAEFAIGAVSDMVVRLSRASTTTGVEAVLQTISGGTPNIAGLTYDLGDPAFVYYLEIYAATVAAPVGANFGTLQTVRGISVALDHNQNLPSR